MDADEVGGVGEWRDGKSGTAAKRYEMRDDVSTLSNYFIPAFRII